MLSKIFSLSKRRIISTSTSTYHIVDKYNVMMRSFSFPPRLATKSQGKSSRQSEMSRDILMYQSLNRLENAFWNPSNVNSDILMQEFRYLHDLKVTIPLSYLYDAVNLYAQRRDPQRVELLLRFAKGNLSQHLDNHKKIQTRSKASVSPYDDLIAYSISSLLKFGSFNEGLKLWVRMASSGYTTNRSTIEHILQRVSSSEHSCPIEFIEKVDSIMKSNQWHQSSSYYNHMLKIMKQHISQSFKDKETCANGLKRIQNLMQDINELENHTTANFKDCNTSWIPIQLKGEIVQIWLTAITLFEKHVHLDESEKLSELRELAFRAFEDLLNDKGSSVAPSEIDHITGTSFAIDNSFERTDILSSFDESLETKLMNEIKKSAQNIVRQRPQKSSLQLDYVTGIDFINADTDENLDFNRRTFLNINSKRSTVLDVLCYMAKTGNIDQMLSYLQAFLQTDFPIALSAPKTITLNNPTSEHQKNEGHFLLAALSNSMRRSDTLDSPGYESEVSRAKAPDGPALDSIQGLSKWLNQSFGMILRHAYNQRIEMNNEGSRASKLAKLSTCLLEYFPKLGIEPDVSFWCSMIEALLPMHCTGADGGDGMHRTFSAHPNMDWQENHTLALNVVDSLNEEHRTNPHIYHAIISLLCRHEHPDAVMKAFTILKEMAATNVEVLPQTWSTMLHSSTFCLGEADHAALTLEIETALSSRLQEGTLQEDIIKAQFFATCRLRQACKPLLLLRTLRSLNKKIDPNMYLWAIASVYLCRPGDSEVDWRIVRNPQGTCDWILREMSKDGHHATPDLLAFLLKLFTKHCQVRRSQGGTMKALNQAEEYVKLCSSPSGYRNHPKINLTEPVMRELIKAACIAGKEDRAIALLNSMRTTYDITPTAMSYEPIIYMYAGKDNALTAAEDLLTVMNNNNMPISGLIVDSFMTYHLSRGDTVDALDCVQDMYNQYGVRPSVGGILKLIDASLEKKDVQEAKRAVSILPLFFSEEDRQLAMANARYSNERMSSEQVKQGDRWVNDYESPYRLKPGIGPVESGVLTSQALSKRFQQYGFDL